MVVRVLMATPIQFLFQTHLERFQRVELGPGVTVRRNSGPMAQQVTDESERQRLGAIPHHVVRGTHLLIVDRTKYLGALEKRLQLEGKALNKDNPGWFVISGIIRQVLISATLLGLPPWRYCHTYELRRIDGKLAERGVSTLFRPVEEGTTLWATFDPVGQRPIKPSEWRALCGQLDRYYRADTWWNDRLAVALGHLWSAVTTHHPELSFAALCMALEAIATTERNEITNTLALRCSLIARVNVEERMLLYREIKDLYNLRSKVVHGRSEPKKGTMTRDSLAITARRSFFPHAKLTKLFVITRDVIAGVLANQELLEIIQADRTKEAADEKINDYFLMASLR